MSRFTVTEAAMRPASDRRECFYCKEPVGGEHKSDCVVVVKKVMVRLVVDYPIEVPAHWDASDVLFHRNEGSWCAGNAIDELKEHDSKHGCLCGLAKFEFIEEIPGTYLKEQ